MKKERLRKAYVDFTSKVSILTGKRASSLGKTDIEIALVDGGGSPEFTISSLKPIIIKGLSERRLEKTRIDLDVAIKFTQQVGIKRGGEDEYSYEIIRSTIRVLYLENYETVNNIRRKDSNYLGEVYKGFHFDMNGQNQNTVDDYDHPMFHAHYDIRCISPEDLSRPFYKHIDKKEWIDSPRIPTAPLDLTGVIFYILRDHLPDSVIKGWPNDMSKIIKDLPRIPVGCLNNLIQQGVPFDSTHWYKVDGARPNVK